VSPDEIIQLEAKQNYTVIYFKDGSNLLSSTNLGILEERLEPYAFFRVNRSVIINLNHLNRFTVYLHKAKDLRRTSRKKPNELFLSRRRVAAFRACVNV
jgi:DNA-binding LytR/AlgR family response regulator